VLTAVKHPFIVDLVYAFQTGNKVEINQALDFFPPFQSTVRIKVSFILIIIIF
jgi:hypothetical protein